MGVYTLVTRPQTIAFHENDSYRDSLFSGFIDGDPDDAEGTTLVGSGSGSAIFSGFDFSSVPPNAIIKSMSGTVRHMLKSSAVSPAIMLRVSTALMISVSEKRYSVKMRC